jgi:bifunctional non-homologous end joining protein LigD
MTPIAKSANLEFPSWLPPMAATLTEARFQSDDWVFERKYDGIRLLAYKNGPDIKLYSRNQLEQNYPEVKRALQQLAVDNVILDGEATWAWGQQGEHGYNVFDVLWLNGRDLRVLPLDERRALLEGLSLKSPMGVVPRLNDEKPWERACAEGWEGVIAKRRDAAYEPKRSRNWLKMKCEATQELVVGGFTDPQRSRVGLGALLVGYYDGDDFIFAGKIGTGFDNNLLTELRAKLDALEIPTPPFTQGKGLPRLRAHWCKPELVVQVAFTEWTDNNKLRHPRLLGVRFDKAARDVVREGS